MVIGQPGIIEWTKTVKEYEPTTFPFSSSLLLGNNNSHSRAGSLESRKAQINQL